MLNKSKTVPEKKKKKKTVFLLLYIFIYGPFGHRIDYYIKRVGGGLMGLGTVVVTLILFLRRTLILKLKLIKEIFLGKPYSLKLHR